MFNRIPSITLPFRLTLRSQQIVFVLSRHGLIGTLASLGLEIGKRGFQWVRPIKVVSLDRVFGKQLADTFIQLGPTFIKLGQVLATRPDIVGNSVADELRILFDRVPPIPFRKIKKILIKEWGKKVFDKELKYFETKPMASASLAQTYSAQLKNGTPVIVKVQKEGVAEVVRLDLILLEGIAQSLHLIYPKFGIRQMFTDFKEATLREIDYREEAKNIEQFHQNYSKVFSLSDVVFPHYYPKLSTERVLVLEPLRGKKVSQISTGSQTAKKAAAKGLTAVLEQIFDHGFFHADPHAGNLFFIEDTGRIGFIDLGLVGRLEAEDKRKFLKVLMSILKRDREKLAENLFALGEKGKKTNYSNFEKDIQELLDKVKKKGIDSIRIEELVNQLLQVARENDIVIPNRYILMIRSCLMIEGVAKSLDPSLSLFSIAIPIVAKSLIKTYNPFRRR